MSVRLNTSFVGEAADAAKLSAIQPEITAAHEKLHNGTGAGNAFLGWVDLPVNYDKEEFARIKAAAEKIKKDSEILIVIGIGGSYLGAIISSIAAPIRSGLTASVKLMKK